MGIKELPEGRHNFKGSFTDSICSADRCDGIADRLWVVALSKKKKQNKSH